MKVVHVIAHRVKGTGDGSRKPNHLDVVDQKTRTYKSGYWDIPLDEARSAIGGMLFLHERKKDSSYFGGEILNAEYFYYSKSPRSDRVVFTVKSLPAGKDQKWRGANYSRAWTGRVIDVPDSDT